MANKVKGLNGQDFDAEACRPLLGSVQLASKQMHEQYAQVERLARKARRDGWSPSLASEMSDAIDDLNRWSGAHDKACAALDDFLRSQP